MRIRMKLQITGLRDDEPWPATGGEIVVPDSEGADLCAQGYAEPVAAKPQAETRPAKKTASKRSG